MTPLTSLNPTHPLHPHAAVHQSDVYGRASCHRTRHRAREEGHGAGQEELENKASNQQGLHFQSEKGGLFSSSLYLSSSPRVTPRGCSLHTHVCPRCDGFALRLPVMWLPALVPRKPRFPGDIHSLLESHRTRACISQSQCLLQHCVSQFEWLEQNTMHWRAYPQQKPTSHSPGAGKSEITAPADSVSAETSLPGPRGPHLAEGKEALCLGSLS